MGQIVRRMQNTRSQHRTWFICKRRPENVALGGEWWSVEKRSAQVITRGCWGRVSGFPENSDRADCGGQECSTTWSCGLRFAVVFRAAS